MLLPWLKVSSAEYVSSSSSEEGMAKMREKKSAIFACGEVDDVFSKEAAAVVWRLWKRRQFIRGSFHGHRHRQTTWSSLCCCCTVEKMIITIFHACLLAHFIYSEFLVFS